MPYRICKTIDIENGHMLSKHPDKCKFPHGHTRKVEFVLEANQLDQSDMVCDFKIIKVAVGEFLDSLDHAICMNTDDPAFSEFSDRYGERVIAFESEDPTTEVMARMIFDTARGALNAYRADQTGKYVLDERVELKKVRVWETATSWAEYEE